MARTVLTAKLRSETGKGSNRRLRAAGSIPGVVYGKALEPVALALDPKAVVNVLHSPQGRNTPIELSVDGEGKKRLAIIRDYQVHAWKRNIQHVDLWEITEDTLLKVTVPFVRAGKSESERLGARVRVTRHDVVVTCKPANVPAAIEFDSTTLPTEDTNITISQVPMPDGVEAFFKHDYSIIQQKMPKASTATEGEEGEAAGEE